MERPCALPSIILTESTEDTASAFRYGAIYCEYRFQRICS
jgi:hypothetical protein